MGNFGSVLATFVTLAVTVAGTYLQIENWRLSGYNMYDTTISDLERLESSADDPVSLAWSIGVIQQSFSDFSEPCGGPLQMGRGFMGLPQLCPLTENQRDLLFRRLQNLECVQLQVSIDNAIASAPSESAILRITDGINLARSAFGSFDNLACSDLISVVDDSGVPESEAMIISRAPGVGDAPEETSGEEDAQEGQPDRAGDPQTETRNVRSAIGAKAEKALDVTFLPARLFVHVPQTADAEQADRFVVSLAASLGNSAKVIGPEFVSPKVSRPSLRYLKSLDQDKAKSLVTELNALLSSECQIAAASDFTNLYDANPAVRPRTFELWIPERCLP